MEDNSQIAITIMFVLSC